MGAGEVCCAAVQEQTMRMALEASLDKAVSTLMAARELRDRIRGCQPQPDQGKNAPSVVSVDDYIRQILETQLETFKIIDSLVVHI